MGRPDWTLGLTGGIGSGKSTVAARLTALGAVVIDADAISRELTAPGGAAILGLQAAFGHDIVDAHGALDRARMRERVFSDDTARRRLESILHPMIGDETARRAAAAGDKLVVHDVPLLAESATWRRRVDRILVVDCDEATQVARVQARSGWDEATVRSVIGRQASRAARRSIADAVIHNTGLSLEQLHAEVDTLWYDWIGAEPARV